MVCKDCVHDDVCEHWKNSVFGSDALYPKENDCEHFKNKANFVEVKHGEWGKVRVVSEKYGFVEVYYQHKDCKISPTELYKCPFENCPRCGAKMDGGK